MRRPNQQLRAPAARPEVAEVRSAAPRVRLAYLDALRAVAALAVVVLHAFQMYGLGLDDWGVLRAQGGLGNGIVDAALLTLYERLVRWSFFAVQVFIVISGFSLMLAVARAPDGRLGGGMLTFFRRRARRILPPYYAALACSILLVALLPGLNAPGNVYWDIALPALDFKAIVMHLLLLHNWDGATYFKINPPMWSIAVEWQIYFLFPLLVVLWRRLGASLTLLLALVWGALPLLLPIRLWPLSQPWFVGLFALGMLGASIGFSAHPRVVWWRERVPWAALAAVAAVGFVGFASLAGQLGLAAQTEWLRDYLLGTAVTCLLIGCTHASLTRPDRPPLYLRLLLLRPLVGIGLFSYSLYLLHAPVLATLALVTRSLELPATAAYIVHLGIGIPLAVLVAYAFFLVFERPFLSTHSARARNVQPRPEAVASRNAPAP